MEYFWFNFSRLTKWGIEFLWTEPFYFVSGILLLNLIISLYLSKPWIQARWKPWYYNMLLVFLCFPALAFIGALGWVNNRVDEVNIVSQSAVTIINLSSFLLGIFFVYKMRGLRWLSISILLVNQWFLVGINWVTTMAITGVWV